MAKRVLGNEGTFTFRYKTPNWGSERTQRCLEIRISTSGIQNTKEKARGARVIKEEIDWKKELLESGRFNDKFSTNLLENGAKNFMQGIYLGYMYSRWKKIRGLDKDDPLENEGQLKSSFKEFENKIKEDQRWKYIFLIRIHLEDGSNIKRKIMRGMLTEWQNSKQGKWIRDFV